MYFSEEWLITTPQGSKLNVGKPDEPMPRGAKVPRLSMSSVSSAGFEPTRSDRVPSKLLRSAGTDKLRHPKSVDLLSRIKLIGDTF